MREEEAASAIKCEELSENNTSIGALTEKERSFQAKEKSTAKDKEAAEYDSRKADGKDESLQKRGKRVRILVWVQV